MAIKTTLFLSNSAGRSSRRPSHPSPSMLLKALTTTTLIRSEAQSISDDGQNSSRRLSNLKSLSDSDLSTAPNDLQPSASFSAQKLLDCIPANTPPVFPGLRPRI